MSRYSGTYTMIENEMYHNRPVWVKQSGRHAIWFKGEGEGWRIGSIREKERNTDNTDFKSSRDGAYPTDGGQWKFRLRNNLYKDANRIIGRPSGRTTLDDRRSLRLHVANFRNAFQGLVNGRDKVVTCIQAYNDYNFRAKWSYNCGDPIDTLRRPCGGNGAHEGGIISINYLGWLKEQIPNTGADKGIQEILRQWMSDNTPGGQPNVRRKVEFTSTGSHNGFAARSLNMKDRLRPKYDLKAHFYFDGIKA